MEKIENEKLKKDINRSYTLDFENRFWKFHIVVTDDEILEIHEEDHRNYSGGISYIKNGFCNSNLLEQLERMVKDGIDDKQAEEKIKYFLQKEIKKIKPMYDEKLLNTKSSLSSLQSHLSHY